LRSIGEITFQLLADHRHLAPINIERNQKYTPNTAIWLFARDSKALDEIEQEDLVTILRASPPLKQAYDLIRLHKGTEHLAKPSSGEGTLTLLVDHASEQTSQHRSHHAHTAAVKSPARILVEVVEILEG
jgi:hypothetical protein